MKLRPLVSIALLLLPSSALVAAEATEPVNPKASVEARALLQVLYDISGKHTLTGDVTRETVRLDGAESHSTFMEAPKVTTAGWSKDGGSIEIESTVTFNLGGNEMKIPSSESWNLLLGGHYLTIERTSTSPRGKTTSTAVYERR